MPEKEDIQKEAEKVLAELSEALGEIDMEETYYVVEDINITRKDGKSKVAKGFKRIVEKNAPRIDSQGNFIMEIGKWVE